MNIRKLPITLVCATLASVCPGFASIIQVTPTGTQGWNWFNDVNDQPIANTITSAQTPPGSLEGSIDMSLPDATGALKPLAITTAYAGLLLSDISELSFETYIVPATGTTAFPFLQLGLGLTPNDSVWEGRLSFVPSASVGATIDQSGNWQTWDALNAVGGWFFTRQASFPGETCVLGNAAIGTDHCALLGINGILARYPTLAINADNSLGLVGFRSNSNQAQAEKSFADMLTVKVGQAEATTFDFTTVPEPSTWSTLAMALLGGGFMARRKYFKKG